MLKTRLFYTLDGKVNEFLSGYIYPGPSLNLLPKQRRGALFVIVSTADIPFEDTNRGR
jgi:hypothetical protein